MIYAGLSEVGLVREENQDAIFTDQRGDLGCFCVADGMGGHEHGERASQEIVACIGKWWETVSEPTDVDQFLNLTQALGESIRTANTNIRNFTVPGTTCGSTVVALLIWDQYYAVLHAGDSRAYMIDKRGRLNQLTIDDVWENQPEIKIHKHKLKKYSTYGKLVNAIGANDMPKITIRTDNIGQNAGFLLCSDGLYKMVEEKKISKHLKGLLRQGPEACIEELKQQVYINGAKDNISIILIQTES